MVRNTTFDIMKGIGIISVIIGHISCIGYFPQNVLFSFHMPLFFILGGFFYHPVEDVLQKCIRDFRRLIVPYLFSVFLFIIYYNISYDDGYAFYRSMIMALYGSGSKHSSYYLADISSIGAVWFLLALFWCRTIYNYLYCKIRNNTLILVIGVAATLMDRYIINLPFAILPGLSAMIFYMIGHKLQTFKVKTYMIIVSIVCWVWVCCFSNIYMVQCYYTTYPIDVIGACGGTFVIYLLSKFINKIQFNTVLIWIGKNSLVILCSHFLEQHLNICYGLFPEIWYIQIPVQIIYNILVVGIVTRIPFIRKIFWID